MISSLEFDNFLKKGYIEGLPADCSMDTLLAVYGIDNWYVKNIENNGLIYGIIKYGFVEFHIYNEKISGISYRPDLPFDEKDYIGVEIPWIYYKRNILDIEIELMNKNITYKKYTIRGPLDLFKAAGVLLCGLEDCIYTFIDTEGSVTFLFEENQKTGLLEVCSICKYYDM